MGLVIPQHVAEDRARKRARDAAKAKVEALTKKGIRRPFTVRNPLGKRATMWIDVVHERDPKEVLFERIGTIPEGVVMFNRSLVAIYQPPMIEKVGNVFITEAMTDEDMQENLFQGKVGLVVAQGPQAYQDDDTYQFHGQRVSVGNWVYFRPSDGWPCDVNEVFCRLLYEKDIAGKIPHPDYIW